MELKLANPWNLEFTKPTLNLYYLCICRGG